MCLSRDAVRRFLTAAAKVCQGLKGLALIAGALCLLPAGAWAQDSVPGKAVRLVHPRNESGSDLFIGYYWRVFAEALKQTNDAYGEVQLVQSADLMNHLRAMEELAAGTVDVYVRAYLPAAFADRLELVPVPIDRGLLGHRFLFTHRALLPALAKVRTLDDLRAFSFGQGAVWVDADILSRAGLKVLRSSTYEGMFPMVQNRHVDLLPRGANEIRGEALRHRETEPDLVVEPNLVLAYPLSFYYMVRKDEAGRQLKARLLLGLQRMRANGTLDRMFNEMKGQVLAGLDVKSRRIIRIGNPLYNKPYYMTAHPELWDDITK